MRRHLGVLAAAAAALSGCGLGAGKGADDVSLRVSDGFGTRTVKVTSIGRTPGEDTVMRVLERHHDVRTIDGGGFVTAIDGLAGKGPGAAPVAWFFYVNGIEASQGAAAIRVRPGDRIWWDRHWWGAAMDTPAVVGAFPAPLAGRSARPVRLSCARGSARACDRTEGALRAAGARTVRAAPDAHHVTVLVGPWAALRGRPAAALLAGPPALSGVFARFRSGGRELDSLDSRGRVAGRGAAGTGLVAALDVRPAPPTWVVTGTDEAGVERAAGRVTARDLEGRFALVVGGAGARALPIGG